MQIERIYCVHLEVTNQRNRHKTQPVRVSFLHAKSNGTNSVFVRVHTYSHTTE